MPKHENLSTGKNYCGKEEKFSEGPLEFEITRVDCSCFLELSEEFPRISISSSNGK